MIKDIKELNFPAYATLETATATIADMGDRTITSQVKIDGDVVPDFSYDWEIEFKGERYIHPVKTPQGTKDNASRKAKIDLVFHHWAIYEMKRQYFVEMASTSAGTAIADKYIASMGLNLEDFVTAFNLVLNHYFGGRIIISLNPNPLQPYSKEAKFVSISYSYIWDVLQQMHEIYGVRWTLKTNADGVCEILLGYPAEEVSHIFEYGFEGGLLSVQRQVQSTKIRNRLLGRGGSKNLPYRYFKDKDPNNPLFEADPDWIPELANIAFTELRGKTFRDYVRGWKAKRYGGTPMAEPTDAYLAGYNAEKFDPIEYVDDKESIEKYGVLVGALENNEEIYPSIQGAPGDVDMIVAAEQVSDDDVDAAVENDSVTTNLESGHQTYRNAPANSTVTIETLTKRYFSVPEGKVGNLSMSLTVTGKYSNFGDYEETHPILKADTVKVTIHDKTTGAEVKSSSVPVVNIPAGDYYYMISAEVETNYDKKSMVTLNIESVRLITSTPNKSEGWSSTFDIWVRNIWGSERNAGETDQQYADRVWLPILGDRMGDEARVVFASGWLSFSSDWEFPIVGYAFDDSKTGSHWRLTLAKIDAEKDAGRPFIPYEGYNASAGDRFFFIGIDMPWQYVYWGEERVDDYKRDRLPETARINPSWVIKTDKVRLNQNREGAKLIDSLSAGAQIRLASKQFISDAYESLYVQSMTYNWTADTILYPDVEVVVSDKVHTVKNPVAQIQGNIETLQRQMGSLSNIQQIIRQVCDQLYLRKDGVEDLSKSPTRFLGKVTGERFRQGQIGGRDWGIYRDENGNAILEADKIVARQGILISDLVVNEATYVGGLQINSAAAMKVTAVEETEDGYICYFDQKQGSVANMFKVDDVAFCQKFDAEDNEVKSYKARVIDVDETSVTLSKTEVAGTGVPVAEDVIIQYGNYTDKTRQFVIIRDVIGGGYERMLMGLDSVTSEGFEYYFAGKSADSQARWFVGGMEQYAKYENGQLTIKGNLLVTGSDKLITDQIAELDYIKEAFGDGTQGLILGTAIIVGYNNDQGNFVPMSGMSGIFDKDSENGGPAAWYGGTPENAKSVIFMDGTGYFAEGLFKWDKDTGVNLGNDAIRINYDGSVDFGGNIRIGSTGEETLDSLLTIIAKMSKLWTLDDEGNLVTEKQVVIKNNLIIHGDMASGGEGEDTPVEGASEVVIDGMRYPAKDGVIDLTEAFANVEVDLSEYYTKNEVNELIDEVKAGDIDLANYYTKSEVDAKIPKKLSALENDLNLGSFAYKNALAWREVSDVMSSNEFNFIPDGFSGNVNINYRTIDKKATGSISNYLFRDGSNSGGYASLRAKSFIVNGGTSSQFLKADGSVDGTSYLPLSGGTMGANAGIGFRANNAIDGGGGWAIDALTLYNRNQDKKMGTVSFHGGGNELYYIYIGVNAYNGNNLRIYPGSVRFGDNHILHSGNYSDYALPKTGGTIEGTLAVSSEYNFAITNNTTGAWSGVRFRIAGANKGYLGVDSAGKPIYVSSDQSAMYTLYHSGNSNKGDVPWTASNILFPTGTSATWNTHNVGAYKGITVLNAIQAKPEGAPDHYAVGLSVSGYYGFALASLGAGDVLLYRRKNDSDWKTLAFTDSTVDKAKSVVDANGNALTLLHSGNVGEYNAGSATKLATARTIWGQSFDGTGNVSGDLYFNSVAFISNGVGYTSFGNASRITYIDGNGIWFNASGTTNMRINSSGNVTIGASDLAGTEAKLYVDGHITTSNNKSLYGKDTSGNLRQLLVLDNGNNFVLGYGASGAGYNTYLDGNNIYLRYGTSHTIGLILNSSGNVLIGTTTDSGYKLAVNGNARISGGITIAGAASLKGGVEVHGSTPYIDFHFGNSTSDYTSRIIEDASGRLYLNHVLYLVNRERAGVGGINSSYKFNVEGTTCLNGATTINGKVSASGGIDIPNGQQLAFLDASGNRHTIAWDSASNGILIDGNLIVLGELATGLPMQEIPSIPEIGV